MVQDTHLTRPEIGAVVALEPGPAAEELRRLRDGVDLLNAALRALHGLGFHASIDVRPAYEGGLTVSATVKQVVGVLEYPPRRPGPASRG
ncbi:hypothetical protein [Salinarimonas soli]|uniref:Uncharacterized protein n=1 Tax=Salinarimonas soli TaxID=1638099 RepID=A0A5B2VD71_9HYPH|nr:hypothetical protein [Salinarimonas soli]KAA2236420.1 hypothetical protein F0L46_14860 [Salinarimonas soli]